MRRVGVEMAPAAPPPMPLKLVVVGDGGVGKSSVTTSILRRAFSEEWDPTIEDSYSTSLTIEGREYQIEIIDTAGQEEYRGMWGEQTVREGDGFILVYSIDSQQSFDLLPSFLHTIRKVKSPDENPTQAITPENTPFPFLLLGNKSDLPSTSRQIPTSTGVAYASALGGLFYECSAKLRENIDPSFLAIVATTAKAKASRLEYMGRRGTVEGWSGNILLLSGGRRSVAVDEDADVERLDGERGGWDEDDDIVDVSEKDRKRASKGRKKNSALKMDRRRSFSVGGLGAHPDTIRNREEEQGCCCVVS